MHAMIHKVQLENGQAGRAARRKASPDISFLSRSLAQRHTSSHAASLEKNIAATAKTHGKLTIMRPVADEAEKQREKDKEGKKK